MKTIRSHIHTMLIGVAIGHSIGLLLVSAHQHVVFATIVSSLIIITSSIPFIDKAYNEKVSGETKDFSPSIIPKFTPKTNCHRVISHGDTWCFTIRGPWDDTWQEFTPSGDKIVLTHGRTVVNDT